MYPLYHGTNAQFDAFSMDFAARPDMAPNGFLGVWFATDREHAQRFGQYCLTVEADVAKVHRIPIGELARWHQECGNSAAEEVSEAAARQRCQEYYAAIRLDLLSQGFEALEVEEIDGRVEIVIVLIPERLRIVPR